MMINVCKILSFGDKLSSFKKTNELRNLRSYTLIGFIPSPASRYKDSVKPNFSVILNVIIVS